MWDSEEIQAGSFFYRTIHVKNAPKTEGRRFPNESCFALRHNELGLSLNWDKYCCEKKSLILIGLRKSNNEPFNHLDPRNYLVFRFSGIFLTKYGNLKHSPVFNGNPAHDGMPNNKSHSELFYEVDELQARMDLSDFCRDSYDESFCEVDKHLLLSDIEELRSRLNDTPYHKDWIFE